jgi:glucose-1-phosphate thymidylyltransferase
VLKKEVSQIIGLIPAAGQATRLGLLPCSKEIYPVGFTTLEAGQRRVKVVSQYLLEAFKAAGIQQVMMVLRQGKWDIPSYFEGEAALGLELAYCLMQHPYGAPFTLDAAYPFIQHATVAMGFPDIIFEPQTAFKTLKARLFSSGADVVLGAFRVAEPARCDMIALGEDGCVTDIRIKLADTGLQYSWGIAMWTPTFSDYMHAFLQRKLKEGVTAELHVGHVLQAALADGFRVPAVTFDSEYIDIGTPKGLVAAQRRYGGL